MVTIYRHFGKAERLMGLAIQFCRLERFAPVLHIPHLEGCQSVLRPGPAVEDIEVLVSKACIKEKPRRAPLEVFLNRKRWRYGRSGHSRRY